MKRHYLLIALLLLLHPCLKAQNDTLSHRIVLIGDAGQLTNGRHPVVDAVKKNIPLDSKTTILFLGDNLYKAGLPDEQYKNYSQARAVLDSQVSIADGTPAKVYMIPGNHDWENGGRGGYNAILRQQLYVDFLGKKNVNYEPEDGCPGPVGIPLGNDVLLVMFDSQWWLHPHEKPEMESDCKCKTREELVEQIGDIITRNSKKLVLLACHHPFKSNGMHGGYYTIIQHLFPLTDLRKNLYIPLPLIGSAYPIARGIFGTPQDISHPTYTNMIHDIMEAVKRSSPNVVFVSGHDHNLQLLQDDDYNYIVSGGGCKQNRTSQNRNSLFNSTSQGFAVMDVSTNKNVQVTFYEVSDSIKKSQPFSILNFSKLPVTFTDSSDKVTVAPTEYPDSVSAPVSNSLAAVKGLRKFFMGQNYRKEWSAPVSMKIFNLRREKGGFKIDRLGGGKQTRSLRLIDKDGNEWVLRNLNKNPSQTIPDLYRGPIVDDLVKELKSSSFPFGAFIVPHLAEPLGIPTAKPELVFVPDDPALEFYRPLFSNTVCILEQRNASVDSSATLSTATVFFKKMLDDNDKLPMQAEVLKARLLDILVADYDRHFDQWRWGTIDTGKGKLYYPIPRDRDQSFFYSDGKLLKFLSGRAMPFLKGFRPDIPKVEWLGYVARDFDRIFLTDLDKNEWERSVASFQQQLSDSVIRNAVLQLPPEIYRIDGEKIIGKLISRRNVMMDAAMKYYRFVSKKVNIVGSNQKEYFKVSSAGDKLQVRVYVRSKGNDTSFIMYDRIFDPSVTKEIRLYGLHDEDIFEIERSASSRIKLRIIGGRGIDTFDLKGNVEALLYDLKSTGGDYYIKDSSHAKKRFSNDPPVNDRSLLGFNYNTSKFPQVHFNYNSDDGMMIGAGFSRRTYGFRNLPYATDQKLSAVYGIDHGALRLQYRGEFNHITRNWDILLKGDFSSPTQQNFFGFGNNSAINTSFPHRYYQTLYQYFETELLLRRRYFEKFHFMLGPYFYHYSASPGRNINNVLGKPQEVRLDPASVYTRKSYAGFRIAALIDNRNKEFFPTRGMHWKNEVTATTRLGGEEGKYLAYTSDMSIYASLREPAKLVALLKFGGGRIFSKSYEYFQAMSIGANNDLPGFRKNRYTGRSSLYGGLEFRFKLVDVNSYILPGPLGIAVFYNTGKVWQPNDPAGSKKWHGAYGAGFYYLPFNLFAISAYAGFSENEKMFNFTLGTKINLTF